MKTKKSIDRKKPINSKKLDTAFPSKEIELASPGKAYYELLKIFMQIDLDDEE